ncbi:hypothetical protein AWB71_01327 [Caballeronia peredens]|nr:hypothetical protein AWB71_01327 [Caballeronia peredens]
MDYLQALVVLKNPEQHNPQELADALTSAHQELDRLNEALAVRKADYKVVEPYVPVEDLKQAILNSGSQYPATLIRSFPRTLPFYVLGIFVAQREDQPVPEISTDDVVDAVKGLRALDKLKNTYQIYRFIDDASSDKLSPEFANSLRSFRTEMYANLLADLEADGLAHILGVTRKPVARRPARRPL